MTPLSGTVTVGRVEYSSLVKKGRTVRNYQENSFK